MAWRLSAARARRSSDQIGSRALSGNRVVNSTTPVAGTSVGRPGAQLNPPPGKANSHDLSGGGLRCSPVVGEGVSAIT